MTRAISSSSSVTSRFNLASSQPRAFCISWSTTSLNFWTLGKLKYKRPVRLLKKSCDVHTPSFSRQNANSVRINPFSIWSFSIRQPQPVHLFHKDVHPAEGTESKHLHDQTVSSFLRSDENRHPSNRKFSPRAGQRS